MAKKGSKSSPSQLQGNTVVDEEKHSSTQKNNSSEIDEIFAGKKRKKPEPQTIRKPGEDATKTSEKAKKKKKNKIKKKEKVSEGDAFVDLPARPRKRTKDGLTIYTEEELQINKADAGGTPLCPFDCSCCF